MFFVPGIGLGLGVRRDGGMVRSDPGFGSGRCTRQRPRSATTGTGTGASRVPSSSSSSPRTRDQPSATPKNGSSSSSSSSSGRRTPKSSRTRHSLRSFDLAFTQHLRPAFVISPLDPTSGGAIPLSSIPNHMSAFTSTSVRGGGGEEYDLSENERPRRTVSSPQLVAARSHGRARSDSASSSASLTATEENYASAARRYHGHAGQGTVSHGTSMAHFPTTAPYPALWTFAAQPLPMPMTVSPTSPDSSDAAITSPSDDATSEEDSEDVGGGRDDDEMIFVSSRASSSTSMSSHMRNRRGNGHGHGHGPVPGRVVTTARGQPCAGETETDLDEMPIRLPTTRNVDSRPVVPLLIDILVPCLFQVTRFLSIVPATFGTVYNCYFAFHPPAPLENGVRISSIDFIVCALWAILTGFQCLFLTTGLLSRWKAFYTAPSTLIRLVALQGICWPATHFTLMWFDHKRRPVACWALIGTTTCLSRSVQLWVTSNLYMPVSRHSRGRGEKEWSAFSVMLANLAGLGTGGKVLREEGKLGPRRWDWAEVMVKCALPAGVLYFLTAWALILKEELEGKVV